MHADPSVLVFGEDVGLLGGVFRITDGLIQTFGESRCFDTPLAESGIVGMAVGMATFDHRVCDGGTAGGFLRYVADAMENPGSVPADL